MKKINLGYDFENQPSPNIFKIGKRVKNQIFEYKDGYKLVITNEISHKDNNDSIEVKLLDPNNKVKLYNWLNSKEDENAFELYNWKMNFLKKNNNYIVELVTTKIIGGGVL
jgi:hypothetical protein